MDNKKKTMQKLPGIVSFRNYESCENLFDFQIIIFYLVIASFLYNLNTEKNKKNAWKNFVLFLAKNVAYFYFWYITSKNIECCIYSFK